jgi:hypothetical protein
MRRQPSTVKPGGGAATDMGHQVTVVLLHFAAARHFSTGKQELGVSLLDASLLPDVHARCLDQLQRLIEDVQSQEALVNSAVKKASIGGIHAHTHTHTRVRAALPLTHQHTKRSRCLLLSVFCSGGKVQAERVPAAAAIRVSARQH